MNIYNYLKVIDENFKIKNNGAGAEKLDKILDYKCVSKELLLTILNTLSINEDYIEPKYKDLKFDIEPYCGSFQPFRLIGEKKIS